MLYVVATPIGNLEDITFRAISVLKTVPIILAEDTRKAKILFQRYQIQPQQLLSYYAGNEKQRLPEVLSLLESGKDIALISEAGTPLISDPGFLLIQECIKKNIPMTSIPGPCAITTLLPLSGFSLADFYFAGFLSPKTGKRKNQLQKLKSIASTLVFYESPHRIMKTLEDMRLVFGEETEVVIGRELTKKFEQIERGTLKLVCENKNLALKGEFVIIVKNY